MMKMVFFPQEGRTHSRVRGVGYRNILGVGYRRGRGGVN